MISTDEYFNRHIPYRLILVTTFRDRFSPQPGPGKLHPEDFKDLYCCAKDACFIAARAIGGEIGIPAGNPRRTAKSKGKLKRAQFQHFDLPIVQLKKDPRWEVLLEIIKIGNEATAHLVPDGVNHRFKTYKDDEQIFPAIDLLEELVRDYLYAKNNQDWSAAETAHRDYYLIRR